MPTKKRGRRQTPWKEWQPLNMGRLASMPRIVQRRGVGYTVFRIFGSEKTYICPGCSHPTAPGTPYTITRATDFGYASFGLNMGVGTRCHWYTHYWGL